MQRTRCFDQQWLRPRRLRVDVSIEAEQSPLREVAVWGWRLLVTEAKAVLLPLEWNDRKSVLRSFALQHLANYSHHYNGLYLRQELSWGLF